MDEEEWMALQTATKGELIKDGTSCSEISAKVADEVSGLDEWLGNW